MVTGTWYNIWALLCLHPQVTQRSGTLIRRCYAKAFDWLPGLRARPLTWFLDALHGAGYAAHEPLVTRGLARLLALQDKNGIWSDPDDSTVEPTATAVRLMRDYSDCLEALAPEE